MTIERDYKESNKVAAFKATQSGHVHYQPLAVRAQKRQREMARAHAGLKPMVFKSLHHHSTYSFLDGLHLPDAHVRRATEINMGSIAMTEHGNNFSHVKLEKAARKAGVKPLFGCEFYVMDIDDPTQKKNHLTVLAKNEVGYRNLLQLVTRSWAEGFYHDPSIDRRWLVEAQEGLIVLSGCQGSELFTALIGGKHVAEGEASYRRGLEVARWYSTRLDDYYIEVQAFPELERTRIANPMLAQVARAIGRGLVATKDVHYVAPEEVEIQKILHNIRPGSKQTLEEQVRDWGYNAPLCPPPTDRAIYRQLRATGLDHVQAVTAIMHTEEIADECTVELPTLPHVRYPTDDPVALWRRWLREGWEYRGLGKLARSERARYRKQLHHERQLIEDKGYVGYFLIVADGVKAAKDHGIPVGPARGSAAGSLCCYLLRITEVDPLMFPLLDFERFISKTREDMPDIDVDFAPSGLPWLREYYENKYGKGSVASVGTFGTFKPKASVDAAARVFQVPKYKTEQLKDLLLERSSGDLRASAGVQDTIEQFEAARKVVEEYPALERAMDLEGNVSSFGTHAAGIVVSNGPITDVTAVLEKVVDGELRRVISMDKYDAAAQGLEKLDYLSLSTLEMIYEALRQLGRTVEDLYDIPLDDPETIKGFQENDTVAIFQFEGRTMRFLNSILKPDNFHEVAHATALVRPGPMLSGSAQQYCAVKAGADFEHVHPALDSITKLTNGQVIFQEQILAIVREIGDFNYTHRSEIRKIISAKKGEQEFRRMWERFRDGARGLHGMDEETSRAIWDIMATAGAYAFNAAHSYSYGMLANWCMFLKRNAWGEGPTAFYAGGLGKLPKGDDGERHDNLRRDAARKGIELLAPDVHSGISWRAEGNHLVAGWEQVDKIGPVLAERIAEYTATGDFQTTQDLVKIPGVGAKTVERIVELQQADDPFGVREVERSLETARKDAEAAGLPAPTHTVSEALVARTRGQMVLLAIPTHRNLRELFEVHRARTGQELDPKTVRNFDPDKTEWVLMPVRDHADTMQLIFTRNEYPRFRKAIWGINLNHDVLLVQGTKMQSGGKGKDKGWGGGSGIFHVNKLWVIDPEEKQ